VFAGVLGDRVRLSALARGATLQALREHGWRVEEAGGAARTVAVQAEADPLRLGVQDLVIVSVKGPALAGVAPAVAALCGEHTDVLVAMNGVPWWFFEGLGGPLDGQGLSSVDPQGAIAAAIPARRVIGGVVHWSSQSPEPGLARRSSGNGLIIGEPAGGRSGRVQRLAELLAPGGLSVTVSERIQRDIWFKLWGNMTMNPLSAITGATGDRILDDPFVRNFCSAVMLEARAIGTAIGIPIDQEPDERHAVTRKLGAFRTSMLQDLEAGRALEIDALVSSVHEIGSRLGLAMPAIETLLGLVRLLGQTRGLYPLPAQQR
jgi:2-dehydropantoate 2-reductase